MLASRLAEGHRIVGIDLAEGMVELAQQRIERLGLGCGRDTGQALLHAAQMSQTCFVKLRAPSCPLFVWPCCRGRVQAQVGDAAALAPGLQDLAGVVSMFGLQQIPQPHAVLANWVRALRPGELGSGVGHALISTDGAGILACRKHVSPFMLVSLGSQCASALNLSEWVVVSLVGLGSGWALWSSGLKCATQASVSSLALILALQVPRLGLAGGVLAVCYWGKEVEDEGPWKRLMDLTTATRPQVRPPPRRTLLKCMEQGV